MNQMKKLLEKHQETAFCEIWTISFHFPNYFRIFAIRNVIKTTMSKYSSRCICTLTTLLLLSCTNSCTNPNKSPLDKMELIKEIGNETPLKALVMLDSLEFEIRDKNNYTQNKYDLLRIRLNDKADNLPTSDNIIKIKRLMKYFEEEGSIPDKQEVYYYAGSTYRDLQDTPRALEYFFKSLDYAIDNKECDPIMLRNTYSNLNYLYYQVQNYTDALKAAIKELEYCKKTHSDDIVPYMHVGTSYLALDSLQQAEAAFDSAYAHIVKSVDFSGLQNMLVFLLYDYSALKNTKKAKDCATLICNNPTNDFSTYSCMAFAGYYESIGENDSAAFYCKQILDDGTDINNMYEASKLLFRIYSKAGEVDRACQYANIYLQISDSLDFGGRQKLAATVNNAYLYHLDKKEEQNLKDEKEKYKNTLIIVSLIALLLASVGYILHFRRRNKQLKVIAGLSSELQRISDNDKQLREDIKKKEKELTKSRKSLENTSNELNNVKQELQRVNNELTEYNEALKEKEEQLAERMEQNKSFIKLLHQSELEGKAEDVIHAIRQSSTGRKNMESADWKQLFKAVDELHPTFKDRLLKELGNFTEDQKRVCYLMRIGLSKPQIQNMTNLARVTIWRWAKKYDWVVTSED